MWKVKLYLTDFKQLKWREDKKIFKTESVNGRETENLK